MKKNTLVLDANIFVEGINPGTLMDRYVLMMTPEVEYEIREKGGEDTLEYALSAGLRICSPGNECMEIVENAAIGTGDDSRLSYPDRTILALALEEDGEIMSDDYSVQNLAAALGIPVMRGLQQGIKRVLKWRQQCVGCRQYYEEKKPNNECPVCGSDLKTVVDRRA